MKDTTPTELSSSSNPSLSSSHGTFTNHVYIEEPWTQALGIVGAYVYGLLSSLSIVQPWCYASDEFLSQKLGVSERQFRRYLEELEEAGWIYRNTYPTPKGKMRHIVPKSKYKDYFDTFLQRPNVPEEVRKNFLEKAFRPTGHPCPKPTGHLSQRTDLSVAYAPAKNDRSLLPLRVKEENNRSSAAGARPPKMEEYRKELTAAGFGKEQVEMGMEYYEMNREKVEKKDNPIAFLRFMVKSGAAADEVNKAQVEAAAQRAPLEEMERNKKRAEGLIKRFEPDPGRYNFRVDEYSLSLRIHEKKYYRTVAWKDVNFAIILKEMYALLSRLELKCAS